MRRNDPVPIAECLLEVIGNMNRDQPAQAQVRLNVPLDELCCDLMRQRDEYAITNSFLWEVIEAARELVCEPQGNETHYARCERVREALKKLEGI